MTPRDIFLRALQRESTPRPATGSATSIATVDLMEKTGFFFPGAHLDAEKMAGLAAAGYTELGFDCVAPLFSVWTESAAMGCDVEWGAVDRMPACRHALYAIEDQIRIPADLLSRPSTSTALAAIRLLKQRFGEEAAIVGKVFGPWTLSYHMFGVEEFLINTLLSPDAVRQRLSELKELTVRFAHAQIEAGADALCLADHATRDVCSPKAYQEFLFALHQELRQRIPCPLILHICGDTSDRIPFIRDTGLTCFHFDSKVPTATARKLAGERLSLMGGTSNFGIIQRGTPETIAADVREKLDNHIDIIGPECAVPLDAPYRNMQLLSNEVKKAKR